MAELCTLCHNCLGTICNPNCYRRGDGRVKHNSRFGVPCPCVGQHGGWRPNAGRPRGCVSGGVRSVSSICLEGESVAAHEETLLSSSKEHLRSMAPRGGENKVWGISEVMLSQTSGIKPVREQCCIGGFNDWSNSVDGSVGGLVVKVSVSDVEKEIRAIWDHDCLWHENPVMRDHVEERWIREWLDIPTVCGFRTSRPSKNAVQRKGKLRLLGRNGNQRKANLLDKVEQQKKYGKCLAWACECGITEDEFQSNLTAVPKVVSQRGRAELPYYLRNQQTSCSAWEHARLRCVETSILKAAADVGRRVGGERLAAEAYHEVKALISSKDHRTRRMEGRKEKIRENDALRLTEDPLCQASGIKPLAGLFELWVREQCLGNVRRDCANGGA